MSIWAAVRGAAGNYLQQEDARKAAEAEAERIRKKEEMAAALREETYAREDMRDQRAAERERDRDLIQAETANRARTDSLAEKDRNFGLREEELGLRKQSLAESARMRDATAGATAAYREQQATDKKQAAANREIDNQLRAIDGMQELGDKEKFELRQEMITELQSIDNIEAIRRAAARLLAASFSKTEGDPTLAVRPR